MRKPAPKAAVETPTTKRCTSCGEEKAVTKFLPSRFVADGYTDTCSSCTFAHAEADRRQREARKAEAEKRKAACKPPPVGVTTKVCRECTTAKPLTEYSKHGRSRDGHRHVCKSCDAAARAKRRASISISDLAAGREKHLAGNRAAVRKWQEKNFAATRAQAALRNAIKAGVIARPRRCQVRGCKQTSRLQGHHYSYNAPLSVLWVCPKHHRRLHAGDRLEVVAGLPTVLTSVPEPKSRRAS